MKIDLTNYEAFFLDHYEGALSGEQTAELMLFLEQHPELQEQFYSFEHISLDEFDSEISFSDKGSLRKEVVSEANFEEMALAYVEGLLNAEQEKDLLAFAGKNEAFSKQLKLFLATRLQPEPVVFHLKNELKKNEEELAAVTNEEFSAAEILFISSVEGTLTPQQQKQLDVLIKAPEFKKELELFRKAKLGAEPIVFAHKDSLYRRKGVRGPAYYYLAAAASVVLLFGFYVLFGRTEQPNADSLISRIDHGQKINVQPDHQDPSNSHPVIVQVKKQVAPHQQIIAPNDLPKKENEDPRQEENVIVQNPVPLKRDSVPSDVNVLVRNNDVKNDNVFLVNSFNDDEQGGTSNEYLSLGQMFASKVKSRLLNEEMQDENSYREDKKKFTWYDAMLVLTKGVRRLTGRDVEVKKEYNNNSELVAYQFTAGKYSFTRPVNKHD